MGKSDQSKKKKKLNRKGTIRFVMGIFPKLFVNYNISCVYALIYFPQVANFVPSSWGSLFKVKTRYTFHRRPDKLVELTQSHVVGLHPHENCDTLPLLPLFSHRSADLWVWWLNITSVRAFKIQTLIVNLRLTFLGLIMYLSIRNTCYSAKNSIRCFGGEAKNSGAKCKQVFTLSPSFSC